MNRQVVTVEAIEDNRLIVWSPTEGSELYSEGFYGKPLGIPKPRETEFQVPLMIDLIEGVYLLEKRRIKVVSGPEKKKVTLRHLKQIAKQVHEGFLLKYEVYKQLREQGYIVTPGIKYGCDFAVYEHGPGIDHAPYIVQVRCDSDEMSSSEIVKAGRLAATVRKTFIIAVPSKSEGRITYLGFRWWRP